MHQCDYKVMASQCAVGRILIYWIIKRYSCDYFAMSYLRDGSTFPLGRNDPAMVCLFKKVRGARLTITEEWKHSEFCEITIRNSECFLLWLWGDNALSGHDPVSFSIALLELRANMILNFVYYGIEESSLRISFMVERLPLPNHPFYIISTSFYLTLDWLCLKYFYSLLLIS